MSKAKRINDPKDVIHEVRYGIKGTLLYLLPIPILIATIISLVQGNFFKTLILAGSFSGFIVAAIIARHGLKLEKKFTEKSLARAPRTPFKTVAALILSTTTGATAFLAAEYTIISSALLGAASFLGFYLSYGLDPRKDKANHTFGVSSDELFDALEAAEIKISSIEGARDKIRNMSVKHRLKSITNEAREIIKIIEADPKDLDRARKFLTVHLEGARRVTETYARTHAKEATTDTQETDFNRVLDSIESNFQEQRKKLHKNDQFDLDVQMEVVETQIKHER